RLLFQSLAGRGNVVLLYFWTDNSYEPWAAALQERFKDRGLVTISVHSTARDAGDVKTVIDDRHIELPTAIDGAGSTSSERAYSVKIWPTYFLIDKEGKVRQGF